MKKHFAKLLTERPRTGRMRLSCSKGVKHDLQCNPESLATRQSMRGCYNHHYLKESHENSAPVRRYLQSQVGRPWDQVYSEICQAARADKVNGRKLIDNLDWVVDKTVQEIEGKLIGRWGYPVYAGDLYVHPDTGLLCRCDAQRKKIRWLPQTRFEVVVHDFEHRWVKLAGLWYFVTLSPIPGPEVSVRPLDVVLKETAFIKALEPGWGNEFVRHWGRPAYASFKRQANKREIQKLVSAAAEIQD